MALLASLVTAVALVTPGFAGPFDVGGKPATSAVVTVGPDLPARDGPRSAMIDEMDGVLAVLQRDGLTALRSAASGGRPATLDGSEQRLCVVHMSAGESTLPTVIWRTVSGDYVAAEPGAGAERGGIRPVRLSRSKFAELLAKWPAYRGDWKTLPTGVRPGVATELPQPLVPGWFEVDKQLLGERLLKGTQHSVPPTARTLADEKLYVRLPAKYDPRTPCGLMVWVDAGPQGLLHEPLFRAADELGLVLVSAASSGNSRYRADRYQLVLDGVATVSQRYPVDPRRVYISGVSGGGKIATHMWMWFPDVFSGAAPVVGLATYEGVPAGPGKVWPADIAKPSARYMKMLADHRCGAITGPPDFNFTPIKETARVLTADRLNVRVFEYADQEHSLPSAAGFSEVVSWIDEPYRNVRGQEEKSAAEALAKVEGLPRGSEEWRAGLVEVTRLGPWTAAAWDAADRLRGQ